MSSNDCKKEDAAVTTCDVPFATAATPRPKKAPSPRNCREFIRKETAGAMLDIVNTFINEAKSGSVAHFTSLTRVGGFDQRPEAAKTPKSRRKSLARQLLDEVERYEARQAVELAESNASMAQSGDSGTHRSPQETA